MLARLRLDASRTLLVELDRLSRETVASRAVSFGGWLVTVRRTTMMWPESTSSQTAIAEPASTPDGSPRSRSSDLAANAIESGRPRMVRWATT